jgi:Raf kinase inhibitor-like YbhB/YbcL family protein
MGVDFRIGWLGVIGRILQPVHAGERHLAANHPMIGNAPTTMVLASPAFGDGDPMPSRHAGPGVGDNISPPLSWSGVPEGTEELVLIMEDPSAPLPRPFVHAVVAAIPPGSDGIVEGGLTVGGPLRLGRNSMRKRAYLGPRPVAGHGPHTYVFQLFAVDHRLPLASAFGRREVLAAMRGGVIGQGRLDGEYER